MGRKSNASTAAVTTTWVCSQSPLFISGLLIKRNGQCGAVNDRSFLAPSSSSSSSGGVVEHGGIVRQWHRTKLLLMISVGGDEVILITGNGGIFLWHTLWPFQFSGVCIFWARKEHKDCKGSIDKSELDGCWSRLRYYLRYYNG